MGKHDSRENNTFIDDAMRDLDSLLESSQDANDVNRRLDFYEKIAKLEHEKEQQRVSNLRLQAIQEGLIIQCEKQSKIQADFEACEAKLKHQIETQKSSMSSLFVDLEKARTRVEWLEAKFGNVDPTGDDPAALALEAKKRGNQGDLLRASSKNGRFFSSPKDDSTEQQRIRELEDANARLKSEFVRLRAEYKEERYLSRKTIEELMEENMAALTAQESSASNSSSYSTSSTDDIVCSNEDSSLRGGFGAEGGSQRATLSRAKSLRRIKEFDERKTSISGGMPGSTSSSIPTMKPLPLKTSLPGARRTPSKIMVDTDDDGDRSCNTRSLGRVAAPRKTRSLFVPAPHSHHKKEQEVNLHDIAINNAEESFSRAGLLSRGLSLRGKNWWAGKGQ
jgi:hypothetical protein